jgi:hypothetical protein
MPTIGAAVKLYRMMRIAADGLPEVGDTFAKLGVRPIRPGKKYDVPVAALDGLVGPNSGGMSVFAGPVAALPDSLRPPNARFPLWEIDTADLGIGLVLVAAGPPHYWIAAANLITLAEYQGLLAATRLRWVRI